MKARSRLIKPNYRFLRLKIEVLTLLFLFSTLVGARLASSLADFSLIQVAAAPTASIEYISLPVEVVREVEVDRTFTTEKQQILAYIVQRFGDRSADAITLINQCENHAFNPRAINYNRNGTVDRGIFQINSIHGGEEMFDWKTNIDTAFKIYTAHGNKFTAWTCAHVVGEKNYLGE